MRPPAKRAPSRPSDQACPAKVEKERRSLGAFMPLLVVGAALSCSDDFDSTRAIPTRGTLGTELFGVICDRVGAQALHEDLAGASFRDVCHHRADGTFADQVDQSKLPAMTEGQPDVNGTPVPLAKQQTDRAYAVARVETMARHRADLIAAFDATFPDIQIPIKDLSNPDPTKSCGAPAVSGEGSMHTELSNFLGRVQDLYADGTIPQTTESIARVVNAFKASPEAQAAWAVYDARAGYRPIDITLGAARPVIAYSGLRDFTNATLKLLSPDSNPYDPNPMLDAQGNRIPVPGAAYPQLSKVLEAAHAELLNTTADPPDTPLAVTADPITGRQVLSRPRGDLEVLQSILYAQDPVFGGGASRYIAQRDSRGYVALFSPTATPGPVTAPFVDADGDGLPDVNALGQFVTSDSKPAPSPFFAIGAPDAMGRDSFGRALTAPGGSQLVFNYIDTSHTYTASLVRNLAKLVDANPADNHETLMDLLAGVRVLMGKRDGSASTTKTYADGTSVKYDAFHTDTSPVLDLVYALGQIMADPTTDDTLTFARTLVTDHTNDVARLVGDSLYAKDLANKDTVAKIPPTSTLWDELIDNTVQIAQEPGLLEDVLRAFGDDATLPLAATLGSYMSNKDHLSYDRNNLNGPPFNYSTNDGSEPKTPVDRSQANTGANRSEFQRFVQTVHDTNGVTACNKDQAKVHTQGVSIVGIPLNPDICAGNPPLSSTDSGVPCFLGGHPFGECEIFKIDNVSAFYVDSMVGLANLYFRPDILRNGFLGAGASTISIIEQSSAIGWDANNVDAYNGDDPAKPGFWDLMNGPNAQPKSFRPKPAWLDRQVYFDLANDSPNSGDKNYLTNHFLTDLQGPHFIGTSVCQERVIPDPCNNNPGECGDNATAGVSADGMVHGLRTCTDGDWFVQRDQDALFVLEDFGFYSSLKPIVEAFAKLPNPTTGQPRRREDLFLGLMEVLHKHWQDASGTADECDLGIDPQTGKQVNCTKDGAVSYEPLLSQIFSSDMFTAIHDLVKVVEGIPPLKTCAKSDPKTHVCTQAGPTIDGISILANSTRALVDPVRAKAAGLVDRRGNATALRNDGTTNPQVTPLYLVLETLNEMDQAFVQYAQANPQDAGRQAQWRRARSQLVDTFLSVNGENTPSQSFADATLPKILPVLIDASRAQLVAHCPPGYTSCTWASHDLWTNAATTMGGPTFATTMDLQEAIRQDVPARTGTEKLLSYLLDAASNNDALAELLSSADDLIQVMRDDANLVPLYHVLATAAAPTQTDGQGQVQRGVIDSNTAFLSRIGGRAYDTAGNEICAKELDPSGVINIMLAHLVTPMTGANGQPSETPLEVILDAVSDVNRASPGATAKLDGQDYANTANELSEFLIDQTRGLEQFYEIVRQGIVH